jgi:hypothetical protein
MVYVVFIDQQIIHFIAGSMVLGIRSFYPGSSFFMPSSLTTFFAAL